MNFQLLMKQLIFISGKSAASTSKEAGPAYNQSCDSNRQRRFLLPFFHQLSHEKRGVATGAPSGGDACVGGRAHRRHNSRSVVGQ